MKIDILAIVAHPDDAELCCSGTLLKHKDLGYSIGIVDLTMGELGSRGSATLRLQEAEESSKILGLSVRENLNLGDGSFENKPESRLKIMEQIRRFQPKIVLTNSIQDRHPDHGRAAKLVADACFYSGLIKIESSWDNEPQQAWRPTQLWHMLQDFYHHPDIVVDITPYWAKKLESIYAFSSQFYSENDSKDAVNTPISGKDFIQFIEARAREMGRLAKYELAEGFVRSRAIGVPDLMNLD